MIQDHPDRVLKKAVWGMLPHNSLGRKMLKKLKVYAGAEHRHAAQTPQALDL
jgi:large subunit ribosomal protein L13